MDIIASLMVLPNRMCVPLIDQVKVDQMRFPLPRVCKTYFSFFVRSFQSYHLYRYDSAPVTALAEGMMFSPCLLFPVNISGHLQGISSNWAQMPTWIQKSSN